MYLKTSLWSTVADVLSWIYGSVCVFKLFNCTLYQPSKGQYFVISNTINNLIILFQNNNLADNE